MPIVVSAIRARLSAIMSLTKAEAMPELAIRVGSSCALPPIS